MSKTTAISKSIPTVIGFFFLLLRAWLFILIAWLAWDCPFTPVSHWFCSRRQAAGQREEWAAAQPCSAVWKHPSMSQQLCQSSKKHLVQSQDAIKALQGSFVKFHHHRLHNSQNAHLEDSDLSFLVESMAWMEWGGIPNILRISELSIVLSSDQKFCLRTKKNHSSKLVCLFPQEFLAAMN